MAQRVRSVSLFLSSALVNISCRTLVRERGRRIRPSTAAWTRLPPVLAQVVIRFVSPIAEARSSSTATSLQHEDEGMMHIVCVYDPADPNGRQKCNAMFTSAAGHAGH